MVNSPSANANDPASEPASVETDGIKILSLDGSLLTMNATCQHLLDIDDFKTFAGRPWSCLWPTARHADLAAAIQRARRGKVTHLTAGRPTQRGVPKWWDIVVSPMIDGSGKIDKLLTVSRDITQAAAADPTLGILGNPFRTLSDNIAQLVWLADRAGQRLWFNARWLEYTGETQRSALSSGFSAVHPDHVARVMASEAANFASGERWEDTYQLRCLDGSFGWFLLHATPVRGDDQVIAYWIGTHTEITRERSTSQRLKQQARLIALSHEAILTWDLVSGITSWNRGCSELYGYSAEEAMGASSYELLQTRHPMPLVEFQAALRQQGGWQGELQQTAKDGSEIWVDSRQELFDIGDRPLVLESNRDITARRQAEEVRQVLLYEIDHRVKNTLAIVQAIATLTARHSLSIAEFSVQFNMRLQALSSVHNLLADTHWAGVDLWGLIAAQFTAVASASQQVSVSGPDVRLPAQVALYLGLIIHELVANAIKYGALSVTTGRIAIVASVTGAGKLTLAWVERGGPTVTPAVRQGFGSMLIERAGRTPQLDVTLSFSPEGLECNIMAETITVGDARAAMFNPRRTRL